MNENVKNDWKEREIGALWRKTNNRHHYRPVDPAVAAKYSKRFTAMDLVTIGDFGGWAQAQAVHFADGGVFDRIYAPR